MGTKNPDWLAGLDQQGFVRLKIFQGRDDAVKTLPVARGLADTAIDDQVLGPLGDVGVQVVHEHPHGGLGLPGLGGLLCAMRTADDPRVLERFHEAFVRSYSHQVRRWPDNHLCQSGAAPSQ